MKTAITDSKIKRLESKYGKFMPEKSLSGWLTFEKAMVSSNENLILTSRQAVNSVLSHHPNKYDEESRDS